MKIAEFTLVAFTLCNTFRVLAYAPQVMKAATDKDGAKAISLVTWALFLISHISAAAYASVNLGDWAMAAVFMGNAVGSAAILSVAVWKRVQHKRGQQRPGTAANVVALFPASAARAA